MKQTRRDWLAAAGGGAMAAAQTAGRPNILFVLSDDHSAPYVGCYGSGMKTPHLDAFARSGMIFDRMFTVAPQCVPSRAGYLTGRSAVAVRNTRFSSPLPPDEVTLPEVLREAGYYTGVCGRGFHLDGAGRLGPVTEGLMRKLNLRTWDRRVDYLDRGAPQEKLVGHMEAFLDKAPKGKPFFLWANYSDPHHGWNTKIEGLQHDPSAIKLPPHLPDLPGVRSDLARYLDEITHCDSLFGDLLALLKRRGLEQSTLVMFCGDNGMAFPHGKGSLYDPGLNVPMLVRWPGVVKPGGRTRELISGEDVAPTLIEAAGAKAPARMSGASFLPLLQGRSFAGRKHIFAERGVHGNSAYTPETKANSFDQSRCVRSARWKLIYNCTPQQEYQPVDSANDPGWKQIVAAHEARQLKPEHERAYFTRPRPVIELFDLDNDPGELNNLAGKAELREVEQELKLALTEKMMRDYDFLPLPIPSSE